METLRRASLVSMGLLMGLAVGCADETTPGELIDIDVTDPVAPEITPALVPVDFEVRALRADGGAPLAGARCAVELESGKYLERLTNAEGVALFELRAWPKTLAVTCAKGHGASWVGLRRGDLRDDRLDVQIPMDRAPFSGVRIEGSIQSPHPAGEYYLVQATTQVSEPFESKANEYQLTVKRNEPFGLLALSYTLPRSWAPNEFSLDIGAWAAWSHRPIEKPATIDVDLSDSVEPTIAAGHLSLPPAYGGLSPLREASMWGRATVFSKEQYGSVLLGLATETNFGPGDRMFYTAESFEGFYADEDVLTQFMVMSRERPSSPYSLVLVEGYPPMGTVHHTFLEPPTLLEPKAKVALEGALVRWAGEGVEPNALLVEDLEGNQLWVNWMHGPDQIVVPRLPTRELALTDRGLEGRLLRLETGALEGFYERVSASKVMRFSR